MLLVDVLQQRISVCIAIVQLQDQRPVKTRESLKLNLPTEP